MCLSQEEEKANHHWTFKFLSKALNTTLDTCKNAVQVYDKGQLSQFIPLDGHDYTYNLESRKDKIIKSTFYIQNVFNFILIPFEVLVIEKEL